MKKLAIAFFAVIFSTLSFSQIEKQIEKAVSSLEKEEVSVDNSYLQGQFLNLIQSQSYDEIINAYHKDGFKRFTKMTYVDGHWVRTLTATSDSIFTSFLDEIRMGLPKGIKSSPTDTEIETLIDDYVTDYWVYNNKSSKKCEIRVYFLNGQLRNIGYWIHE